MQTFETPPSAETRIKEFLGGKLLGKTGLNAAELDKVLAELA